MSQDQSGVAVSVDNVHVDKAILTAAPAKKSKRQALIELTPLLSVLITAVALVTTSSIQLWQSHKGEAQKLDSDWRSALEKVSSDNHGALASTLEMQSFTGVKYEPQARSISDNLLPRISDPAEFDVALQVITMDTLSDARARETQAVLVNVARDITSRLQLLYDGTKKSWDGKPAPPADGSFENFILHPELFLDERTHFEQLKAAQENSWRLDSVTEKLSGLWRGTLVPNHPVANPLQPTGVDLSGVTFLNGNFVGVDFRKTEADSDFEFVGNCVVTRDFLPSGIRTTCPAAPAKQKHGA